MIHPSLLLRRAILLDAVVSGVMALFLTFDASTLASLLDLPETLLRDSGLFLVVYVLLIGRLGTRRLMLRTMVLIVIAGNVAWTLGSVALLFSGALSPNMLGGILVAIQAIASGTFAELQYIGLRKSGGAVAA
jgi:hypothetical protein